MGWGSGIQKKHIPDPDPGVSGAPDRGFRIRILSTGSNYSKHTAKLHFSSESLVLSVIKSKRFEH
jgi:hypothetical protein